MDIHLSELDDTTHHNMNPYAPPSTPLEPRSDRNNAMPPKRKKASFGDILSNMNMVVDANGVLQFMSYRPPARDVSLEEPGIREHQSPSLPVPPQSSVPLDPTVKHSYIYNKYFKDYHDPNAPPTNQPRVPKTKQEYVQMLLEDMEQKKKIQQIKSTKMLFTGAHSVSPAMSNASQVRPYLRSLNFR